MTSQNVSSASCETPETDVVLEGEPATAATQEGPSTFSFVSGSDAITFANNELFVRDRIVFETDSDILMPESYGVMEALREALQNNPQISLLEIQSHRDPNPEFTRVEITRGRALALVEALVQRGVDRTRLRAAGWGERCPVVQGFSERNRRIRLLVVAIAGEPTGVELGCPGSPALPY